MPIVKDPFTSLRPTVSPDKDDDEKERRSIGLTPRGRRFARQTARSLKKLEMVAGRKDVELPEQPKHNKFLQLLHNLDRPRNMVHNAIHGAINDDLDDNFWQNLGKGWTFEESAHFEDILDSLGYEATFARKVMGFAGDMAIDPLPFIPIGRAIRLFGKAAHVDKLVSTLGKSKRARQMFMRNSGDPIQDEMYSRLGVDLSQYLDSRVFKVIAGIAKRTKRWRKNHKDIEILLAENQDLDLVRQFVKTSVDVTDDEFMRIAANAPEFHNLQAINDLRKIQDPDLVDDIIRTSKQWQKLSDWVGEVRAAKGQKVPTLGDQLTHMLDEIGRARGKRERQIIKRELTKGLGEARELSAAFQAVRHTLKATLDPKEVKRIYDRVGEIAGQPRPLGGGPRFESPEAAREALLEMLQDVDPKALAGMKVYSEHASALYNMDKKIFNRAYGALNNDAELQAVARDYARVNQMVERLPRWVIHVATEDATRQFLDVGWRSASFRQAIADPRTASNIMRKFVDVQELERSYGQYGRKAGRALSFEEIEEIVKAGGTRVTGGRAVTDRLGKVAKFFHTDIAEIGPVLAQQTAKSVSASEYLNEAVKIFGKTVDDIPSDKANEFMRLSDLGQAGSAAAQIMPRLKNVYFHRDIAEELMRRHTMLTNPDSVIPYFDVMQNWWKSFTLFMFPAYHARNVIGDTTNMMQRGFMDDPRDIMHAMKGARIQKAMMTSNTAAARSTHVYHKAVDQVINGQQVFDLALRNGVVGTGWFGAHIGRDMKMMMDPMFTGFRSYMPFSNRFLPVRWGKRSSEFLENQRRLTFFIHRLEKGDNVRTAAAGTKKALGDFRNEILTPFEREAMGRAFPFFRWMRYNVPKNVEDLVMSGRGRMKIMGLLRAQEDFGPEGLDASDLPEWVPQWVQQAAGVPVRRNEQTGELEFLLFKNWTPSAEIDNILSVQAFGKMAVDQLTPFVKAPIEAATGVSLYQGRPLPETVEFLGKQRSGAAVNLLKNIRLIAEFDRYDPIGAFRHIRSDMPLHQKILRQLGTTIVSLDPEREQFYFDKKRKEELARRISIARRLEEMQ